MNNSRTFWPERFESSPRDGGNRISEIEPVWCKPKSNWGVGTGDLFERADAYYVYLRDPRLTEDEIRAATAWAPKATVPSWIAMPAH